MTDHKNIKREIPRLIITPFGGMIAFGDEDYARKRKMASAAVMVFAGVFFVGLVAFGYAMLTLIGAGAAQ